MINTINIMLGIVGAICTWKILVHEHKWTQMTNIYFENKDKESGRYFFCEKCFAFKGQLINQHTPRYEYKKAKK